MKVGKLDSHLLEKIVFRQITFRRPEVTSRPGIGEDCAVVDFGEYECVMSTDPITAAIHDIGRRAIHITCTDIASNGIQPLGIMLAVLLPPIPPLVVAFFVFFRRRAQEREGVASTRLR